MIYLLGLIVALVASVAGVAISEVVRNRRRVRRRLQPLGDMLGDIGDSDEQRSSVSTSSEKNTNTLVALLEGRFPLVGGVKAGMIGAGVALLVFTLLVVVLIFLRLQPGLAVAVSLGLALAAGYSVMTTMESTQQQSYSDRLLLAMEDFQRMVRFGIPTMQALNSISETAQEPLKASLRSVLSDASFGVPLEQAMAREAHRVRMSELAMLAAILSTQASSGGNLSESVGNLAVMLRERRDNRVKMRAMTAESRVTLIILGLVPVAAVAIQWKADPGLVDALFGEARHLLGIGLACITAAFVVSWLLMRSAQR